MMMTACDLSAIAKPWEIQSKVWVLCQFLDNTPKSKIYSNIVLVYTIPNISLIHSTTLAQKEIRC